MVVNDGALGGGVGAHQTRLPTNLGSDFVMGQTRSGENGDLLSTVQNKEILGYEELFSLEQLTLYNTRLPVTRWVKLSLNFEFLVAT